jgi:Arc/MetJ family transcription regulator
MMQNMIIDIIRELRHPICMRTTLSLDDDILALATQRAKLRGVSLGKTVSDLVRRGLSAPTPAQEKEGLVVFQLPADSPPITTEAVRRLVAEGG